MPLEQILDPTFIEDPRRTTEEIDELAKSTKTEILICAFGVIRKNGSKNEFFIQKRSIEETLYTGEWDIPGGMFDVKRDKTPEETVIHETKEETDLDAVIERKLGVTHTFLVIEGKPRIFRTHIYELSVPNFDEKAILLNKEHDEWRFYSYPPQANPLPLAGKTEMFLQWALT